MVKYSLIEKYPEIAKGWHPSKNGSVLPADVSPGSSQKAWWICKKGHEFEQRIRYQVTTNSCPYCSGKKVADDNSLAALFPEIANEWHPTENGNLKPSDFRPGSKKAVWWQCPKYSYHVYQSVIDHRTRNKSSCSICQQRAIIYENSIMNLFPELMEEWDFDKNIISPDTVGIGSQQRVWWICKNDNAHKFDAVITERVKGKKCPKCFPKNSTPNVLPFVTSQPDLLKEWDYKKNQNVDPSTLRIGSTKKVGWVCSLCGHNWSATVNNRARRNQGCPRCRKSKTGEIRTFAVLFPDIVKEWHPTKNSPLTPFDLSYGSGRKVWWQCLKNKKHVWLGMVRDRTKANPQTCPECKKQNIKTLAIAFPEIAKEWHPTKNYPLTPSDVTSKSGKKVWWLCSFNPNHEWEAEIKNRTILNSGCKHCFKERADFRTTTDHIDAIVSNSEFYKNYQTGIANIVRLLDLNIWDYRINRAFKRMIYANIVTLMEAYLSDTFIKTVLGDANLMRKFIESTPKFIEEKITVSNIYNWMENAEKKIKEDLLDITYHNIWKVQKMYKNVLQIDFSDNLEEIQNIINVRHDIVHRSGKTKDNRIIIIAVHDIKKAIDNMNKLINIIEKQFSEKFDIA